MRSLSRGGLIEVHTPRGRMGKRLTVHMGNEDLGDLADAQPRLARVVWLRLELAAGALGTVDHWP